jgi:hypothetical protein
MKAIRIFALSALSVIGLSVASAQAGEWHYSQYRPIPACALPIVVSPPVVARTVVCQPIVRPVYYRPAVVCGPRVSYWHGCR